MAVTIIVHIDLLTYPASLVSNFKGFHGNAGKKRANSRIQGGVAFESLLKLRKGVDKKSIVSRFLLPPSDRTYDTTSISLRQKNTDRRGVRTILKYR